MKLYHLVTLCLAVILNVGVGYGSSTNVSADYIVDREQIVERFYKLSKAGGLIDMPKLPEEYYHNAKIYELNADYINAQISYEGYLDFKLDFIDPVLEYVKVLKISESPDHIANILDNLNKSKLSAAIELAVALLIEDKYERYVVLNNISIKYPEYTPVFIELSHQLAGNYSGYLDDSYKINKKIESLINANKLYCYYFDKKIALNIHEEIKQRIPALEKAIYYKKLNSKRIAEGKNRSGEMSFNSCIEYDKRDYYDISYKWIVNVGGAFATESKNDILDGFKYYDEGNTSKLKELKDNKRLIIIPAGTSVELTSRKDCITKLKMPIIVIKFDNKELFTVPSMIKRQAERKDIDKNTQEKDKSLHSAQPQNDPLAVFNYVKQADYFIKNGQYDEALNIIRKADTISHNNHEILSGIGWILTLNENYKDAAIYLEKALKINSKSISANLNYAHFYMVTHKADLAKEYYFRAILLIGKKSGWLASALGDFDLLTKSSTTKEIASETKDWFIQEYNKSSSSAENTLNK